MDRFARSYPTLRAKGERLVLRFINPDMENLDRWMKQCIEALLSTVSNDLDIQPADRVGINFANLENDKLNFAFSFRRFDQYSPDLILNGLESVLQSNTRFFLDDCLVIKVDHYSLPVGYGRRSHVGKTSDENFKLHKSSIFNPILESQHNTLCLAVSIVVARAYKTDINQFNFFTYSRNYSDLIDASKELCQNADVDLTNGGSIDEIIKFQNFLGCDFRITVFSSRDGKSVYFKSCHTNYIHTINLLLDYEHYSAILKPLAAFATPYFCDHCSACYATKYGHKKCIIKCNSCLSTPPCLKDIDIKCDECNRTFVSARCYHNHIQKTIYAKHNVCSRINHCLECSTSYMVKSKMHICGESYCSTCKTVMPSRHECYMPVKKKKKDAKNGPLFIFYDFECYQNKPLASNCNKFEHEVMLCVAHQACENCTFVDNVHKKCLLCGKREHVFIGENVVKNFMMLS